MIGKLLRALERVDEPRAIMLGVHLGALLKRAGFVVRPPAPPEGKAPVFAGREIVAGTDGIGRSGPAPAKLSPAERLRCFGIGEDGVPLSRTGR